MILIVITYNYFSILQKTNSFFFQYNYLNYHFDQNQFYMVILFLIQCEELLSKIYYIVTNVTTKTPPSGYVAVVSFNNSIKSSFELKIESDTICIMTF